MIHPMTVNKLRSFAPLCLSKSQLLKSLGIAPCGGNYRNLNDLIGKNSIDITHFKGKGWSKGLSGIIRTKIPLEKILVKNSTYTNSNGLRKRLIKEGIFEKKCYECNRTIWNDKEIPLELEHKNGDKRDNRIENLTIMCPNCHALTPFYRGRNINNKKVKIEKSKKLVIKTIGKTCPYCGSHKVDIFDSDNDICRKCGKWFTGS
jgi:Zn finger protein HypA/HybF involved in hydrogenase expression